MSVWIRLTVRGFSRLFLWVAFASLVVVATHRLITARVGGSSHEHDERVATPEEPTAPEQKDASIEGRFVRAAAADDTATIRDLLAQGVAPDGRDARGYGPLHQAAGHGAAGAVRLLLERGAQPDAPDGIGWSPLAWATFHGSLPATRVLLEFAADPNARYEPNFVTPLDQLMAGWHLVMDGDDKAVPFGHEDWLLMAEALFVAGADPNLEGGGGLPLDIAVFMESSELVALFFEYGAKLRDTRMARRFAVNWPGPLGDRVREAARTEGLSW